MKKIIFGAIFCFIVGIVGGIFGEQILWPYLVERPLFYQYHLEQSPVYVTQTKEIKIQENQALQQGIEEVQKAVVAVRTKISKGFIEGSGLSVTSDGLVVVRADLIPPGFPFTFVVEGKEVPYQVLKRKGDLALVKITMEESGATVAFADSEKIQLGQRVFLVGRVWERQGRGVRPKINQGVITEIGAKRWETNITEQQSMQGSPAFDLKGQLVGLAVIGREGKVKILPSNIVREFTGL